MPSKPTIRRPSLLDEPPFGRMDVATARGARALFSHVEQNTGLKLWENGLGEVVEELIRENVPSREITAVDVARHLGILRRRR